MAGCGGGDQPADADPASMQLAGPSAPNIVVVMTDDQAVDTMHAMPRTRRILGRRGTTFEAAVASFPLCCPSRASFLTGLYAHNHGVLDNSAPAGGLGKLSQRDTLPVWLDRAGYRTAFIGKYLNGYGKEDLGGQKFVPPGWDSWFGLTADTKKAAFRFEVNRNGEINSLDGGAGTYKTDVLSKIGARTIASQAERRAPLFLWLATSAPHTDSKLEGSDRNPEPAPRHRGQFEDERAPRSRARDERDVSDKPDFVRALPRLSDTSKKRIDLTYRSQLESLVAIDELVANLVDELRRSGELDDTLFVFTSDNGYLRGQHRIESGKAKMYEESILVPLLVMGPGFDSGEKVKYPVANVDLAPTIMEAAGIEPPRRLDGVPLTRPARSGGAGRDVLIEVFSRKADQFTGVRTRRWSYAERSGDTGELYDLRRDPQQLDNLFGSERLAGVRKRLGERLEALRDCSGAECH